MTARAWVLLGHRGGDNAQVLALAEALGLPFETFTLVDDRGMKSADARRAEPLAGYDNAAGFDAPWPDLVIGIGRRKVPVARWIAAASGGKTRIVWLGTPCAPSEWFDLVLTTPQYHVPDADNVIRLSLPFSREAQSRPAAEGRRLVVVLGGKSRSARITDRYLNEFVETAKGLGKGLKTSVSTSPRSPAAAGKRLKEAFGDQGEVYDWRAQKGADNPYRDWLKEAGECLVSGDSMSLIADTVGSGAPVNVLLASPRLSTLALDAIQRFFLFRSKNSAFAAPPPDITAAMLHLVKSGLAERKGNLIRIANALPAIRAEQAAAVERVKAVLADADAVCTTTLSRP